MTDNMDYQALLRTVLEYPFDDAPRLVMADWLEETLPDNLDAKITAASIRRREATIPYLYKVRRWFPANKIMESSQSNVKYGISGDAFYKFGFVWRINIRTIEFVGLTARRLFETWPITEVLLTDAFLTSNVRRYGGEQGIKHLQPLYFRPGYRSQFPKWFPAPNDWRPTTNLHEKMSRACVDYGRKLAGLLPIDWKEMA